MMFRRIIFILLLSAPLFNCSDNPGDSGQSNANLASPEIQSEKDQPVSISPIDATVESVISIKTDSHIIVGAEISWYVNDNVVENAKSLRYPTAGLKKGDIIQAVIIKDDKEHRSNKITIRNTPPVIQTANLSPRIPVVSSTQTVHLKSADVDGDVVAFSYKWSVNGKLTSNENFLDPEFRRGDIIELEVIPYDNEESGNKIRLKRTVANSLPVFSEIAFNVDDQTDKHLIVASDPDGDALTYKLKNGPDGMTVDPASGVITWENPDYSRSHDVEVLINDSHGAEILVPFTVRMRPEGIS